MGRSSRPRRRVGPKMPQNKMAATVENDLIAFIFTVQDICRILATVWVQIFVVLNFRVIICSPAPSLSHL